MGSVGIAAGVNSCRRLEHASLAQKVQYIGKFLNLTTNRRSHDQAVLLSSASFHRHPPPIGPLSAKVERRDIPLRQGGKSCRPKGVYCRVEAATDRCQKNNFLNSKINLRLPEIAFFLGPARLRRSSTASQNRALLSDDFM
jgi:hypothetical protein